MHSFQQAIWLLKQHLIMKYNFIFSTFLLVVVQLVYAQPPANKGYKLLFNESFSGDSVNEAHWRYRLDRRTGYGYMNGLNIKEAVYVKDSALHIVAKHELINGKWENTGGGIISKHNFGYGYYECLSKPFMAGKGVHTSFWQRGGARPNNNIFEIDGYEIDSKTYVGANNLYVDLAPKGLKYAPWPHRVGIPFTVDKDGWFLDAYEFTPEGVIFYDNGKIVAKAEWNQLNVHQTVWLTALNGVGKVDTAQLPGESIFKYFRYYAKDYPGITILPNGNFEYNSNGHDATKPLCWLAEGTKGALKVVEGAAFKDDYKLYIGASVPHSNTLSQTIEYINNGEYQFSAMVRSSGGQNEAYIKIYGYGGKELLLPIVASDKWKKIAIPAVNVTNNTASFAIVCRGEANQWIEIDDINFMKPLGKKDKAPKQEPMFEKNGPMWKVAVKEPVYFPGDQRFFFFDRNVGYGDTISVSLQINADEMANTTPIARMPKKGNAGWGIQLRNNGGIIFRIGSNENHTDVVADDVYQAGKMVKITCVFENGTASIYKNNRLIKQQSNITQTTKDATTPGKLGTVGKDFEAVGDVMMQMGNSDKDNKVMKNFKGHIQNVRIYNRLNIQ